ncbi:hypothetical protein, partial [Pseudomonas sp. AH2 (2023)]|uniref:hypothetical protein n=1 Tax=Pseudomonas sp. AH2 (2023) TaxID=3048599 RepID=UPI002B2238AA
TPPRRCDQPIIVAGREFTVTCGLSIPKLAPLHQGLDLAEYVDRLDAFCGVNSWAIKLRRTLLLSTADGAFLRRRLKS